MIACTPEKRKGPTILKFLVLALLAFMLGASPALAETEQCRFVQAKPEREACYARQEAALAAKRKPAPGADTRSADTRTIESLQQMRRDDAEVYRSLSGICRGC